MVRKALLASLAVLLLLSLPVFSTGLGVSEVQAQNSTGTNWAILISGGYNKINNHARYWNDISEMYEILTGTYGYSPSNVYVLYADGNPPTSSNCHDYYNADGSYPTYIIDYSATLSSLGAVCSTIAALDSPKDTLFVFTTDHGSDSGTCYLVLWYPEFITASAFAGPSYIGKITQYAWRAFEVEQCYSGGFVPALSGPRTAIATACSADESSYAMWPPPYYDEFCYYFNAALKGAMPDETPVNADANGDGKVSFVEAYNYAQNMDSADETPQYDDNGDDTSHTGQMPGGGDGELGSMIFLGETHYSLTVSSDDNGEVDKPGEDTFTYSEGTVVDLLAVPDPGYVFVNWTGDVSTVADEDAADTTITMSGDYSIQANFEPGATPTPTPEVTPSPTPLPWEIYIEAVDAEASEIGPDPGRFYVYTELAPGFYFDGWTKVYYTIEGTAQNGVDYEQIQDCVYALVGYPIIPPPTDAPAEYIDIVPIADSIVEGDETVRLVLQNGRNAQVIISDGPPVTPTPTPGPEEEIEIALKAGWNMVSVPVIPADSSVGAVFPGVAAVYAWDPVNKCYTVPTTIEPEKGYMVAVTSDRTIVVSGEPVTMWNSGIEAGWDMIGSVYGSASIASPDDDPDGSVEAFGYWWNPVSKSFVYTTDIELGKGYMVAATQDCALTMSAL